MAMMISLWAAREDTSTDEGNRICNRANDGRIAGSSGDVRIPVMRDMMMPGVDDKVTVSLSLSPRSCRLRRHVIAFVINGKAKKVEILSL